MEQNISPSRRAKDIALRTLVYGSGIIVCIILALIIGYIFYRGVPGITAELLTTQTSYVHDTIGILPNILNTLYIILVAMVIVIPLGVCAAVYLNEYARNKKLVRVISFAVETLTGIPSVIFGLVGMLFFIQMLGLQAGVLAGGLTLVVMVLPTIISNTLESLKTIPNSYREGSLALGSGKWHMVRTVVLPNAMNGIATGCSAFVYGRFRLDSEQLHDGAAVFQRNADGGVVCLRDRARRDQCCLFGSNHPYDTHASFEYRRQSDVFQARTQGELAWIPQ